jgi:hypothetical protein
MFNPNLTGGQVYTYQASAAEASAAQASAAEASGPEVSAAQESGPEASAAQASAAQASGPEASAAQASGPEASAAQASAAEAFAPEASAPEASAPQSSTLQMSTIRDNFDTTGYLTYANQNLNFSIIPPYSFYDGFVLKTESQLRAMSLNELIGYSSTLSTSAGLEYSTIIANQRLQNTYNILIQLSQSTMDGLDYEIQINKAEVFASKQRQLYLQGQSTMYVSTIEYYENDIEEQSRIIDATSSSISGLAYESGVIESTIAYENSTFISSAVGYSTLYYIYLGWDAEYLSTASAISSLSTLLANDMVIEKEAYENMRQSTSKWQSKSDYLSTLYSTSYGLQEILGRQRIEEADAIEKYNSTTIGISTLSTLYTTAVANRKYALALAKKTEVQNNYMKQVSTLTEADLAYMNSIPLAIRTSRDMATIRTDEDYPTLGNSLMWSTRKMADQAVANLDTKRKQEEYNASTLQTLAGVANSDFYNATMDALQATVISKLRIVDMMAAYKNSSLESLARFSSIYEQAANDVSTYTSMVNMYSSIYESSMVGSSTLYGLAAEDTRTINSMQTAADAISRGISTLNIDYSDYTSSYLGYIALSSIYTNEANAAANTLSTLSSFYDSTNNAITSMSTSLLGINSSIIGNNSYIFVHSSILNSELINQKSFRQQIMDSVNMQERAAYEYKETYCRQLRLDLQSSYEDKVLTAIQGASTANGAIPAPNPPVPVNLNTPDINTTYNGLTSIASFLTTFTTIYDAYDRQNVNIQSMSTSIGAEKNTWSTLNSYATSNFYSLTPIPALQTMVDSANIDFSNKKDIVTNSLQTYSDGQKMISDTRQRFDSTYSTFFSGIDLYAQQSTISSFMISGYNQAIQTLASQGIIFTL